MCLCLTQLFLAHKKDILQNLDNIDYALQGYYNSTIDQLIIKSTSSGSIIVEAVQLAKEAQNADELKAVLKKIVAAIPNCEEAASIKETELIDSLNQESANIRNSIEKNLLEVTARLKTYQGNIQELVNQMNVWKPAQFKFSPTAKHSDVKLLSPLVAKASNNSGYKFAIMDPSLEKLNKLFAFQIKESTSNWLAVGMCHKKVVESKNFGFNFGSIGHGGYMVSSNGGSWSHTKPEINNTIKVRVGLVSPSSSPRETSSPCGWTPTARWWCSAGRATPTNCPTTPSTTTNSTPACSSTTSTTKSNSCLTTRSDTAKP
jgi:hypothetical protein